MDRVGTIAGQISTSIGVKRVHLVGISLGGMIAQACTLAQPSHVASMTLIDTAATFPDDAGRGCAPAARPCVRRGWPPSSSR